MRGLAHEGGEEGEGGGAPGLHRGAYGLDSGHGKGMAPRCATQGGGLTYGGLSWPAVRRGSVGKEGRRWKHGCKAVARLTGGAVMEGRCSGCASRRRRKGRGEGIRFRVRVRRLVLAVD